MLNKRVIHKAFGEGMIIRFENDIVTVEFAARTVDFRYPDAFSKFLTLADGEEQKNVSALAAEAIQRSEEKKRAREEEKFAEMELRFRQVMAKGNKKRKLSAAEQKQKEEGNLAFKANFCDGGCSPDCIGFKGVCSPEQIRYNIEKKNRAWCSDEGSPCGRYYRGEITYEQLLRMHEDSFVCYEARMLTAWRAEAGDDLTDEGSHKARRITNAKQNGLAVLTTVFPGSNKRVVFGVFITGRVDEGDDHSSGYVQAAPGFTVELTPDEAKQVEFWNYYKNSNTDKKQWGTGLYRYLSNDVCVRLLERIIEVKSGEGREQAERILARFCKLKGITR